MEFLTDKIWSPYVVGIGIGILSWATMLISQKQLGCSTTFARSAGMIEKLFIGRKIEQKPYYQKVKPVVDWQYMLVIGVLIGAFAAATLSGDFNLQWIPSIWQESFGDNLFLRVITAIIGGIFIGMGARWADGCTSGHGISGAMSLSISSWVSAICFFIGGVIVAQIIFNIF